MAVFIELLLIGVGLSMDAFAVSICKGLAMRRVNKKQAFVIGLFFGGFQALMPFIGWALGTQFESYITSIDHWIAFVLLVFIGIVYVVETLSDIIQITYFKKTHGKRIFKMAPIHHHFELCGIHETKIVTMYMVTTAILCVITLLGVL